ncbi:MAG: fibronectin type III domain-containing protein [Chloroflexi bacterium]|nr:fibronectin type III domain-containing protein [Chloroflexota bacterium]
MSAAQCLFHLLARARTAVVPAWAVAVALLFGVSALLLQGTVAPTTLAQGTAPDAPTSVAVYSIESEKLEVRWSSSDAANTTSFKIQWKSGSEEFDSNRQLTTDPSTSIEELQSTAATKRYVATITGLTDGTEYTVRVLATNSNGDSDPSNEDAGTPQSSPGQVKEFIETEVIELFESSHPWLRATWDYITTQNVTVTFTRAHGGFIERECSDRPIDMNLHKCEATKVTLGRSDPVLVNLIVHELAHVYTLANGVADTPGPLGVAFVYFHALLPRDYLFLSSAELFASGCRPSELYADALSLITLGSGNRQNTTYWNTCELITTTVAAEALAVVTSAAAGNMPTWFADTYNDSEGNPDHERFWLKVKSIPQDDDRQAIVFQLRDSFGGYCDNRRATQSVFGNGKTRNPWMDGGCVPDAPTSVSATTSGSGKVTVSWQESPGDGGSPIEGYRVHWKSAGQNYAPSRMVVVTDLTDLQAAISGLTVDQSHTFRVLAYNHNGGGEGAETTLTPTSVDSSAPLLLTARLDTFDSSVRLTYNEPLDESSVPPDSALTVSINGVSHTPSIDIEDNVVTLTTSGNRSPSDVLTVTYSVPTGANAQPLKDSAGNHAADFAAEAVRNDSTQAAFTSDPGTDDTYSWNGGAGDQDVIEVTVTFSEPVLVGGTPELSLLIGDKPHQAVYHSGSGTSSLIFRFLVTEDDEDDDGVEVVRGSIEGLVRYVSTKAVAPAGVELSPDSGHLVDAVRPVLLSAGIVAGQSDLTLTWDKTLDETSVPHFSDVGFYVWDKIAKQQLVPSMTTILGRRVTLTLPSTVAATGDIIVSFRTPSLKPLKDTVGNYAAETIAFPVTITRNPNSPAEFPSTEDGARSVDENTPAGRNIGAPIAADDADNDQRTYSIAGTDAAFFDVASTSGQLRTKADLDREGRDSYSFTLSVTDGVDTFGFADTAIDDTIEVTITINDIDEPATVSFTAASSVTATEHDLAVDENHAGTVATFNASDPENKAGLTYQWSVSGTDGLDFAITSAGVLTFAATPDYEDPADSSGNNVYDITVNALDSDGKTGRLDVTVTVDPVNEPPTVTGGTAPAIEEEGAVLVGTYTASDPEGATLAWQPLAGVDSDKFEFSTRNGRLTLKVAPDFEDAQDSGTDNVYNVILSVSAGGDATSLGVAVTVTNREEPGALSFPPSRPLAEVQYTATLSDPDGVVSTVWTWERSTSRSSGWTAVSGAVSGTTTSSYAPLVADIGYYLRAIAAYEDRYSPGKSLAVVSPNTVREKPGTNASPEFADETTTRSVAETAGANAPVGARVTATDTDSGDTVRYELDPVSDLLRSTAPPARSG